MVAHLLSCLLLVGLVLGGPVAAQPSASPGLTAVARPDKNAGSGSGAASPAAAPRFSPDSVFVNPEVRPQFTGGEAALHEYLKKNLHLPAEAARQHLVGRVLVSFVLSATGLVTYATVARGPHKILNEEALRLVWHMPAWQPAYQHGQPVRVSCTLPINFEEF
ncbi:MAG: energy transducer TonB [Cytophagaceae bacterium]|nr:MAG: energy transducer TonB [Cytophagaceae bacterium]